MNLTKSIKSSAIVTIVRITFVVLIALLPGFFAVGQVKFTTVASSQEIGRGDYLQVEFVVENAKQIDQLNPPDFPGFRVIQGPIQSSGMSIVNGNMSQYKALSFVLQPVKTGKFTIEGAAAMVDGKRMQSNPVIITVNTASSGTSNRNSNPKVFPQPVWPEPPAEGLTDIDREYIVRPGENIKEKIRKNLFVKVQVDKATCYVGEPIVATYKLYSRLRSESRVSKRPSLNGFSVYDMIDPGTDASLVERVNGKPFTVHIIRKTQLIPLQAGTIDLDPVEVENMIHFAKDTRQQARNSEHSLRDLFDQLVGDDAPGTWFDENVTLNTKPLPITVKPLPEENKPTDYNGAVGRFSMQAQLTNTNISAQDEVTLKLVVKGSGNLPVINAPQVQWPSGVEAFNATAREDVNKTTVPMSGSKTFEYIFTPKAAGHYTIPAIAFSFFDPAVHSYKKIQSEPLDFQVAAVTKKTDPSALPVTASSATAETGGIMKKFIQQHLESLFAVLILSSLAFYLWRQNLRLRAAERQKEEEAKKAKEILTTPKQGKTGWSYARSAMLANPLQEAKQLFENSDYKGFYRELNRAVWKAVTDKLDLPASELNKSNIAKQLQARGWDADTTRSLENILNECEMNLYMPAYDTYNMQQLLRQAETLFRVLIPYSSY